MGYSLPQLAKFYEYNVDNNVTDHVLAATYTLANFDEFVDKHRNNPHHQHRILMSSPLKNRNNRIGIAVSDPKPTLKCSRKTSTMIHGRSLSKVK